MVVSKHFLCNFCWLIIHLTIGVLAHLLRMVLEPKYLAFWRWLYTPCSSSDKVIGSLGLKKQPSSIWDGCFQVAVRSRAKHFSGSCGLKDRIGTNHVQGCMDSIDWPIASTVTTTTIQVFVQNCFFQIDLLEFVLRKYQQKGPGRDESWVIPLTRMRIWHLAC